MDFHADKPIYQQIIDYAFANILSGVWLGGERVPSVRDLAAMMSVNTHTALKAYDYLQARGIISMRRGMGYYLAEDARAIVEAERREQFLTVTAPEFFRQMRLLGLTLDDLKSIIDNR
ncbi:MAG: GntR family transcriptional regulator [Muribaculaceae bacterium]|nr:GntR family transcriptional regulator [Muribaculaceae bacterium]